MKQNNADYQVVPYPKHRRAEAVLYRSVQHKPMIHGLIEVDVTRARAHLREHQAKTGESLSFTAFLYPQALRGIRCPRHPFRDQARVSVG